MRILPFLLIPALFFSACSGSKDIQLTSLNQAPCQNETQIDEDNQFTGETVDDLVVYKQGKEVYASMDVRTYCNARIKFDLVHEEDTVVLKIINTNQTTDDCLCEMNVTTSFSELESGTYDVMITSENGNQLLAQQSVTIE